MIMGGFKMYALDKRLLLRRIEQMYGNLDNERGSYINNRQFSVSKIVEIINESEDKKDLLLKIESAYGNLDNEKGSYINNKVQCFQNSRDDKLVISLYKKLFFV